MNATADGTDGTGDATLDAMLDATLDPALDEGVLAGLRRCHGGGGGGGKTATGAAGPSEANSAPAARELASGGKVAARQSGRRTRSPQGARCLARRS